MVNEATTLQVLEKLDFNDSTVQHVVLASIPPQQPAASMPEVNCSGVIGPTFDSSPVLSYTETPSLLESGVPRKWHHFIRSPACLRFLVNNTVEVWIH